MKEELIKLIRKYKKMSESIEKEIQHKIFSPYWCVKKTESRMLLKSIDDLNRVLKNSEKASDDQG